MSEAQTDNSSVAEFHISKKACALRIGVWGTLFILISLWAYSVHTSDPRGSVVILLVGIALCAPDIIDPLNLLRKRPVLKISPEGISHTYLGSTTIKWGNIQRVGISRSNQQIIGIVLSTKWLPGHQRDKSIPKKYHPSEGFISVPTRCLEISTHDIYHIIHNRLVAANTESLDAREIRFANKFSPAVRDEILNAGFKPSKEEIAPITREDWRLLGILGLALPLTAAAIIFFISNFQIFFPPLVLFSVMGVLVALFIIARSKSG